MSRPFRQRLWSHYTPIKSWPISYGV